METFAGTLLVGALTGWALEQSFGIRILRWTRQKKMMMRALRRQGLSPLLALKQRQED